MNSKLKHIVLKTKSNITLFSRAKAKMMLETEQPTIKDELVIEKVLEEYLKDESRESDN